MMRKLFLLLSLVAISVNAQNIEINLTESGAYEKKEVVKVDSTKAIILYERAMIALSDWTGPDGKAKAGIDYQEKETGTVIYKGRYSLGFKNIFLGGGWYRYAEFTLKVRCKDGRAQVTVTVPSITAIHNRNGMTSTSSVAECLKVINNAKGAKHERGVKLMTDLTETADGLVFAMCEQLKNGSSNDEDF